MSTEAVTKTLSPNDIGRTGSHQAGILVPKVPEILSFFPPLAPGLKNPRQTLCFMDDDQFTTWDFQYIYYNNKLFGGTRNEYRLTGMTKYLRKNEATAGDDLVFWRDQHGGLRISLRRLKPSVRESDAITLSGGWRVVSIKTR